MRSLRDFDGLDDPQYCRVKPKRRGWGNAVLHAALNRPVWSVDSPSIFDAEFPELCPHSHKSALEDADYLVASLGLGESGSVYEPTPGLEAVKAEIAGRHTREGVSF
jgi:hypothetical protein